jgi:hypothetical protein
MMGRPTRLRRCAKSSPLASGSAAIVLAGEAALGMMLLGKLFEKFDLSAEMTN